MAGRRSGWQFLVAGDDHVAEALDGERAFQRALDENVATVGLVALAGQQAERGPWCRGRG